jgi:hypothetical protein
MIKRHSYPTKYPGCEIFVSTERMKDGRWSVVTGIEHQTTDGGVQSAQLPVTHLRFDTEEEAYGFGMAQGHEYLERMAPAA